MKNILKIHSRVKVWKDVNQFITDNNQFSLNQIRWLIRNRKHNGLGGVLRKVGKRWYLNEDGFADWLDDEESEEA